MELFNLVAPDLNNDFFDDFLQEIAFKGLAPYYQIKQSGKREGTSLGEHVLMGDMLLERLKEICQLNELEEKIVLAAYTVHDMNKIERFSKDNIPLKKASNEDILEELERVNFLTIFSEAEDYIEDIGLLVRNHSDKFHTGGSFLSPSKKNYKLNKKRLDQLLELIRAVDIADLSHDFDEEYMKAKFLTKVNVAGDKQYFLVAHRVSEHRGILTNMVHNATKDYLEEEYGWIPIFTYPEGIHYLAEKKVEFSKKEFSNLARSVEDKIDKVMQGEFSNFISSTSTGIKVDIKCLDLGVSFEQILKIVNNRIHSKKSYNKNQHSNTTKKIEKKLKKLDQSCVEEYSKFFNILLEDAFKEEEFYLGELLRAYYNILRTDKFAFNAEQAWNRLYELFEVKEEVQAYFELLSGQAAVFYRHYPLARYLIRENGLSYEDIYQVLEAEGTKLLENSTKEDKDSIFKRYIYRILSIDGKSFVDKEEFKTSFDYYLEKPYKQCSTCGLDYEVDDWMAGDVQDNIKIQFFSNRLKGGGGEPKRNICKVCNKQFVLEKLNFTAYSQTKTMYLHFYPKSFYPDIFLESFKKTLNSLKGDDRSSILLLSDKMIVEELKEEHDPNRELIFKETKSNGNPLPDYSEVIGNVITLPLNCPGDNNTQQFIFALQQILIWMRYFNFRAILSESAVPPLKSNEFDRLYLDNLPFNLKGIIGEQNLQEEEVDELWEMIKDFYAICSEVDEGTDRRKIYAQLLRTAADNLLELFFVLDRLIVKNSNTANQEITTSNKILDRLERILFKGGKEVMETAKVMAELGELGAGSYIKGKSYKRNSLLKPIDIIFDLLERKSEYLDEEIIFATATQEIFDHISRISPEDRKPGDTKYQKIEEFITAFKEKLFEGVYKGKLNELIADQKVLKSAYLFYYRKASKDS
ncbi:CRISPR-associated protein Csc3 [Orenia metallireducens]|uniref:CRISPR-associated protein Csc3 n=1 Tax=Orenia metallireducens TaxID=1413210 RepID=A0A285I2H0_9FIRM|nr:type I-D CRISPR-associated protein Cas10d/Csc3 [Orenia metallireducens]SNY41161.1 CRISPR-associated protein Csc3 [Orenia metallireducens]